MPIITPAAVFIADKGEYREPTTDEKIGMWLDKKVSYTPRILISCAIVLIACAAIAGISAGIGGGIAAGLASAGHTATVGAGCAYGLLAGGIPVAIGGIFLIRKLGNSHFPNHCELLQAVCKHDDYRINDAKRRFIEKYGHYFTHLSLYKDSTEVIPGNGAQVPILKVEGDNQEQQIIDLIHLCPDLELLELNAPVTDTLKPTLRDLHKLKTLMVNGATVDLSTISV